MSNLSDLITATSAQELMVQSLKDAGFEGDLTPGSPIYQLLIDPNAIIYAANVAKQDEIKNSWSLLSGQVDPNTALNMATISNIFNNLRILPTAGARSAGKITLVFATNTTRSLAGARFIASDGSTFSPKLSYTLVPSEANRSSYSASELLYRQDAQGYSVEIEVEASEVGSTAVGAGDMFTTTLSGLISAHASTSFSGGYIAESIEDLIKDVPETLSETSMVSPISVITAITNNFPQLNEIAVFRAGDAEMRRANRNFLGVDSGSADIVVTTSVKPSVSRAFIPGHLELTIDEDGVFWNSNHRLGYAYRQPDAFDAEKGINADEVLNSFVYIEGQITDRTFVGASSVLTAGIVNQSTLRTTELSPDTPSDEHVTVLSRDLVQDTRYGRLPIEGTAPEDFYFSAYQHRLKFEFRTDWEEVEKVLSGVYNKVYTWLSFWSVKYQGIVTNNDVSTQLDSLAASFQDGMVKEQMPETFRPEVPIYFDVVYYSGLADIQTYLNDDSRRCFGQDYLVKTPYIQGVEIAITVSREANFLRFREGHFRTKIANYISGLGLSHTSSISTEHIKALIFEEGSNTVNDEFMMEAIVSTILTTGDTNTQVGGSIQYFEDQSLGITPRNSVLICSENNVNFRYL